MAPHPAGPVVPLPLVAAIAVAFVAAILLLWRRIERDDRLAARVRAVRRGAGADVIAAHARGSAGGMVAAVVWLGEGIARSGLLSSATLDELQQTLRVSGFNGPNGLSLFVAAKLLLLAGLPVLMIVLPRLTGWQPPIHGVLVAASGILGLLAPDQAVRMARKRYLNPLINQSTRYA